MMSPVAASKPACSAAPLPRRVSRTTMTSGHSDCATSIVLSLERPSTTMISCSSGGIRENSHGRFAASFSVGITTDTRGCGERELFGRASMGARSAGLSN